MQSNLYTISLYEAISLQKILASLSFTVLQIFPLHFAGRNCFSAKISKCACDKFSVAEMFIKDKRGRSLGDDGEGTESHEQSASGLSEMHGQDTLIMT